MTNVIKVGNKYIGGDNAITIQSMTNIKTSNVDSVVMQINDLVLAGCDIVRVAVCDYDDAHAIQEIKSRVSVPIVADIHFDYKLAIASMDSGADKIRINPGNIGLNNVKYVVDRAREGNIPIRIGVNCGSLDKAMVEKYHNRIDSAVASIAQYVELFESFNYTNIALSVKSSSVKETIDINRKLSQKYQYPLHIGVTEAGVSQVATIKSAVGIGSLLMDGIGDTIRVSITGDPVQEVVLAKSILSAIGLRGGVEFVSCPTCGRCSYDMPSISAEIYNYVSKLPYSFKVAIMGCEVNGPGECADADIGMAGGKGRVAFFKKGKVYRIVSSIDACSEFIKEIDIYCDSIRDNN